MYQKLEEIIPYLDLETMFYSSDTMSYIGRGLLEKGDRHTALQWFRRAYYTIAEPIFLVSTANIIKIHHAFDDFVQAMLQAASDEHLAEASQIVCSIEKRWGISPITMHWSIQILRKSQPEGFDNSSIGKLIERTIDSSDITKQNIGLLLHYINVIGADDLALAMSLLDKLQASVIIPNHSPKSQELLNMCILRRVWLVTTDTKQDGFHFVSDLRRTLMSLYDIISGPLEAETASAVHLVWELTQNKYT
jgi:hypothetical protein